MEDWKLKRIYSSDADKNEIYIQSQNLLLSEVIKSLNFEIFFTDFHKNVVKQQIHWGKQKRSHSIINEEGVILEFC